MRFTEPVGPEWINSNTARISGCIYMPAEKIQMVIDENLDDDDPYETYFYADVDENGNFAFENLDLRKFGSGKCDMQIGICCGYDKENNSFENISLRWYRMK